MCSAVGGVLDKLRADFNEIEFNEIDNKIKQVFQKNDFLSHYGFPKKSDENNTTIKYHKFKQNDRSYFNQYVAKDLITISDFPEMNQTMRKRVVQTISELFINSVIHSESEHIYTCGQFFPQKEKIEFTITDTGVGFKNNINRRFNSKMSSTQAIKWAMVDGNSTKKDISGGIGLAFFGEFIKANKGKLQIISDDGFFMIDSDIPTIKQFDKPFPGTIVNMKIRTNDQNIYYLDNNEDRGTLF